MSNRLMKDSGVEWIGEIPANWKVCRFKNVVQLFTGNSIKDTEKDKYEDSIDARPYISTKDIDKAFSTIDYDNGLYVKYNDYSFRLAPKGSSLMCIEGGSAGIKKAILNQDVSFVNKLCCFYGTKIDNRYLYYFLLCPCYEDEFQKNIVGLIGGVSVEKLKNFSLLLPSQYEQICIADFLDRKCAEIDGLLNDIQAQIDDLEQYKKSVITEAVTKGLNPEVPMKDSGIEWVGMIPRHWKVIPNKHIMKKKKDICSKYNGEDILSLTMNGVIVRDLDTGGKKPSSFDGYQIVYPNNLLMCLFDYDVTPRCIGLVKNYGLTSPAYCQFVMLNGNSEKYYYYYFLMIDHTKALLHLAKNLRHSFTEEQLGSIIAPVPPAEEQIAIAEFLDKVIAKADSVIMLKQEQLEELEKYKKSLIYEYVTGKKELK